MLPADAAARRLTRRSFLLVSAAAVLAACRQAPPSPPSTPASLPLAPALNATAQPTALPRVPLPPALARLPRSAVVATLQSAAPVAVQPLDRLPLTVDAGAYRGPATLQLYDATAAPVLQHRLELNAAPLATQLHAGGCAGALHALLLIDEAVAAAAPTIAVLTPRTLLESGVAALDTLLPRMLGFLAGAHVSYELNGRTVSGYRSPDNPHLWLRDHVYQAQGFAYRERDVTSLLDAFRAAQRADGSLPDVVDDPRYLVSAFRKEVEADVEFLYVQGVYEAWLLTGDDEWLAGHLPSLRSALRYLMSDPLRWDAERRLVRRPYTIDMWDFSYGPAMLSPDGKLAPRHWIDDQTIFGIFHGDNTGLAHALNLMSRIEAQLGHVQPSRRAAQRAAGLISRLNQLAWNGRFYTHFIADDPSRLPTDVDVNAQLSLSNAYALNRAVLERRQAHAVIETYYARRDFSRAFAEWYSIDPPFPAGSYGMAGGKGELPGEYVNGGILPLVGGELAHGAFQFDYEPYGFDILLRYAELTRLTDASYLWYYPDGRAGISSQFTLPTDGWGAAAMTAALIEGAGGIVADAPRYRAATVTPRWHALAGTDQVRLIAHQPASDAYLAYRWQRRERGLQLQVAGSGGSLELRLQLPPDAPEQLTVLLDGRPLAATIDSSGTVRSVVVFVAAQNVVLDVAWQ